MRTCIRIGTGLLVAPLAVMAGGGPLALEDETARINYSLGYQIGGDFRRQRVEMNPEAVIRGIEDALSGAEPLMPPQEMHATLMALKRKVVERKRSQQRATELRHVAEGQQFLEKNAAQPGVSTTPSGLQYQILEPGAARKPAPTDRVTVHYRGTRIDGHEFDSSHARDEPATFGLDGVIKGWTEGLQLIGEGGRIRLFIPPVLAYGDRGPLAHQTLLFDVELIAIRGNDPAGQ